MKDVFNILDINRYKLLENLQIGITYHETNNIPVWSLTCIGTKLDKLSEYLKSNNIDNTLIKGELLDEVKVILKVSDEIRQFAGSYIPEVIEELYDKFYCKIKDYLTNNEE